METFSKLPYFQNKGKSSYLSHTEYGIKEHHPRGYVAQSKSSAVRQASYEPFRQCLSSESSHQIEIDSWLQILLSNNLFNFM